ncbi:NTP transferase domain-containing protein [Actinotalea ferrariae]|uniref:NTP transferase domain-containing protein n=1 Tax=Actinotalea ferrariae TaxID=1386098 RepID=UPI0027E1F554|nr:NTP transferase domain-containing protein [Actinotalea ferrariae]
MTFDVLVLAGGEARRLGGASKPDVVVAGRTLLDRALDAARGARRVVVVGPPGLARPGVTVVREDPPSGGPVAGIAAGLAALDGREGVPASAPSAAPSDDVPVVVLACDVPLAALAVPDLLAALGEGADGAHLVDAGGRPQLVAVYRRAALRRALGALERDGGVHGVAVRRLRERLAMVAVADPDDQGADADTWDDVERLDALLTARSAGPPDRRDTMDAETSPDAPTPTADALLAVPPAGPVLRGSDLHRWVVAVADVLGVDPDALDVDTLLDVTRDVAHSVARPAVPLTAFLAGYAVATSGGDREAFDRVVDRVGALAAEWAAAVEEAEEQGATGGPGPAGAVPPAL